ncbi:MAG: LptF/LptG family permease [Deferribacteraceae bacterium]|nr:LptF/LptG family permease [Deferribacteraceae bacterium]
MFDKYVLSVYIKYIIVVQALIMILTMFTSAISHMQGLQKYGFTLAQLAKLELLTIPMGINSALPITMTAASIITVLLLMRSKELMAYVSLGGRVQRFLMPFIAASIAAAAFMIFFDSKIYPPVRAAQQQYYSELKRQKVTNNSSLLNRWIMDDANKLVHIGMLDPVNKNVRDITEYIIDDSFQISHIRIIPYAYNDNGTWIFKNIQSADLSTVPPKIENIGDRVSSSPLLTDLTSISGKSPKQLAPNELKQLIRVMKSRGLNTVQYEMFLGAKYANALSVIVLVLLAVPIGIDFSRRYSPLKSAATAFAFCLSFWAVMAAMSSLGGSNVLPALAANYLPLAIFLVAGVVILYRRERSR